MLRYVILCLIVCPCGMTSPSKVGSEAMTVAESALDVMQKY